MYMAKASFLALSRFSYTLPRSGRNYDQSSGKRLLVTMRRMLGLMVVVVGLVGGGLSPWDVTTSASAATVAGTSYYVSPAGSGTSCTQSNPCSLGTGISNAGAGDEVVLEDGVYDGEIVTQRDGVTFRAENRHKAIIRSTTSQKMLFVQHSNTTVRGLHVDGINFIDSGKGVFVHISGRSRGVVINNILFEDNIVENSPNTCLGIHSVSDVIVRHNLLKECGFSGPGEGIYIGESKNSLPVFNIEVYGNTLRRYTQQAIDMKYRSDNVDVHHNIFEMQHYKPNPNKNKVEGGIVVSGTNSRVHDNIFRNLDDAGGQILDAVAGGNNVLSDNVIYNVAATRIVDGVLQTRPYAIRASDTASGASTDIYNNTFCDAASYDVNTSSNASVHDNPGIPSGAAQSACDTEEERILSEMQTLPGYPGTNASVGVSAPVGLIAYYTFDNTADDASGNGIHGTLNGNPQYVTGKLGQALSFDGVDDYVSLGTHASLDITGAITVAAWVKTTDTGTQDILSNYNGSTGFIFALGRDDNGVATSGVVSFFVSTGLSTEGDNWEGSTGTVNDGKWHHIAAVNNDGIVTFYIDGVQADTGIQAAPSAATGSEKRIGMRFNGSAGFNGALDDLRIYNQALSSTEIQELYNSPTIASPSKPQPPDNFRIVPSSG